ncbi:memo-like protein-domain-containing protein [Cercophora scortea]|uniref:Memo-like protein-domain-containing protein n=1 Tax=Cercophora scortea TaxID=314031 RepID=A0AAE0I7T8_9PEZI|nr:memo-like protein-domain-containing protein [Cercophora scortea]
MPGNDHTYPPCPRARLEGQRRQLDTGKVRGGRQVIASPTPPYLQPRLLLPRASQAPDASAQSRRMLSSLLLQIKQSVSELSRRANGMRTRQASHAGSWYSGLPTRLSSELDKWLALVPDTLGDSKLPIAGARVIIAPHAGYSYSGPCAAWAYKALDLRAAKRVFVLGPSHTYYLQGCALTSFDKYRTPFGDLVVDSEVTTELEETGGFQEIPSYRDVEEHSLEMHLPYLWKRLEQTHGGDTTKFPRIVPILVGDLADPDEKHFGQLLAPYLKDPENAFIISSDFCHWGERFTYRPTYYTDGILRNIDAREERKAGQNQSKKRKSGDQNGNGRRLISNGNADGPSEGDESRTPTPPPPGIIGIQPSPIVTADTPIHEFIKMLDDMAIEAVETGVHSDFYKVVQVTKNSVCGRHPIGVVMAALEVLEKEGLEDGKGKFKFVQYQRSNLVSDVQDFSVSYASAYAIV